MRRAWVVSLCLVLAGPGVTRDMNDGWLIPPAWERSCAIGTGLHRGGSRLSCGTGRLFGMPDLSLQFLSAQTTRSDLSLGFAWQTLGAAAWREQTCEAVVGWGRRAGVDLTWSMRRTETLFGDPWSRQEVAVALRVTVADVWWLVVHADPLSLSPGHETSARSRWLACGGRRDDLAWAVQIDRRRGAAPTGRGAVMGRLVRGIALGVMGEPGTGSLGLTTIWVRGGLSLRTSHLVHPALGVTHRWMLILGEGTP